MYIIYIYTYVHLAGRPVNAERRVAGVLASILDRDLGYGGWLVTPATHALSKESGPVALSQAHPVALSCGALSLVPAVPLSALPLRE